MSYNTIPATLNGRAVSAIVVNGVTHLALSSFIMAAATVNTLPDGRYSINGHETAGVQFENKTYVPWNIVPGTKDVKDGHGGWDFTLPNATPTPTPNPVPPTQSPAPSKQTLAVIHGSVHDNAFFFTLPGVAEDMQLDTGAFRLTFAKYIADSLNLPNLGAIDVVGVGGSDSGAYQSQVTFTIGGVTYSNVPCVVDPNFQGSDGLFGFEWFIQNGISLLVDPAAQTLTLLK